jgi:hypothetical protein
MMTTTAKNHIGRLVILPTTKTNDNDDEDANNQIDSTGQVKVYQFDDDTNDEVLLSFTNSLANDLNKSTIDERSSRWPSVSVLSRRLLNRVSLAKKRYIKRDRKQIVSSVE